MEGNPEQGYYGLYIPTNKLDEVNANEYVRIRLSLPEGMVDRCNFYYRSLRLAIRPDSPVMAGWLDQEGLSEIRVENFASFDMFTPDEKGEYQWFNPLNTSNNTLAKTVGLADLDYQKDHAYHYRLNSGYKYVTAGKSSSARKMKIAEKPDPASQTYSVTYRLSYRDIYETSSLPAEVYEA